MELATTLRQLAKALIYPTCLGWWLACLTAAYGQGQLRLEEVRPDGIAFEHHDGSCGRYYILEPMSAGLVVFDFDGDGDQDIYFLNGGQLCEAGQSTMPDKPAGRRNALYRNDGNWRFTDVTDDANVGDTHHGLGVTAGDFNNDGAPDLYLNNYGPNVLYLNQGDGTFADITLHANVTNGHRVGAGTCFLDADRDGDLDLYVANYCQLSLDDYPISMKQGIRMSPSPTEFAAEADSLFRNNGDGTFTDISQSSGLSAHAGRGMGAVCADYDRDGDTDILVANDTDANFLFQNDGYGKFDEVGLLTGFGYDGGGATQGSMGVTCGDYNNDGYLDFHVTSFQAEHATLYESFRGEYFSDVSLQSGAAQGTKQPVTWGNGLVDFDHDGDRDLFVAAGHVFDNVHLIDQNMHYESANLLFENIGHGRFRNVSTTAGSGLLPKYSTRGAAFDDLDADGDVDVVLLNSRAAPTFLENQSTAGREWIQLELHGRITNRDAVGTRVEVRCPGLIQVAEVHSGHGYQGHFGSTLHFGLGDHQRVDIEVQWLDGSTTLLSQVAAGQSMVIVQPQQTTP